jgi:hypothetical protein
MKTFKQYLEEAGKGPPKYMKVKSGSGTHAVVRPNGTEVSYVHNPKPTEVKKSGKVEVGNEEDTENIENLKSKRGEITRHSAWIHPNGVVVFKGEKISHGGIRKLINDQKPEHSIPEDAIPATIHKPPSNESHKPTVITPHREISNDEKRMILDHPHLKIFGNFDVKKED